MSVMAFDTETTGLNPYNGAEIFSFSITDDMGRTGVHRLDGKDKDVQRSKKALKDFFANTRITKVCHNLKFDLGMVLRSGLVTIPSDTHFEDTMLMSQCLRNDERSHALDSLAIKYGGRGMVCPEDEKVTQWFRQTGSYQKVPVDLMTRYQIADGERTMILYKTLWAGLQGRGEKAMEDYRNEVDLIITTIYMEATGLLYNKEKAAELKARLLRDVVDVETKIQQRYNGGLPVNIGSGKQLGELLFKKMGFKETGYTDTGVLKTDKEAFLTLRQRTGHEIFDMILKHRSYSKATQMMDGYEKNICPDGRLHPNIKTNHAATGREACDSPNLQNVSKEVNEKNPFPVSLRTVFRADPGTVLLFVDYAGIEMRLIIDATQEPELMTILTARGDVHRPTMECFLDLQKEWTMKEAQAYCDALKVSDPKRYKSLRGAYKNTGFCVAYGGGDDKVAFTLGKPLSEIKEGCVRYRRRFNRIARFSTSLSVEARKNRYITTPFGRRLYVPPDQSYIASNYMIQGTAAGILKRAQNRLHGFIQENYAGYINLVLPIHDEVVISVKRSLMKYLPEIVKAMSHLMTTGMSEIRAPLDVEWKMTTTSWSHAKGYEEWLS